MRSRISRLIRRLSERWHAPLLDRQRHALFTLKSRREAQILLTLKYRELLRSGAPLPTFDDVEFRCFSQNGEDGILLYLFALIGATDKRVVEICAGDGIECNAANLIVNHGWTGLLVDGNAEAIARGRAFYETWDDTFVWPPTLLCEWVTAENVNDLIRGAGITGEIDLLSLDIDGVDYWIWQAIECVEPRVVVVEYQNLWGPEKAVTVPYRPDFQAEWIGYTPDYAGASLAAFVKLAREKGYRLVGCQRYGFNAFFVREGLAEDVLPEVDAATCFQHPQARHAMESRVAGVAAKEWVEV